VQALLLLERLIAGVPEYQDALMSARASDTKTDNQLPALQLLLRVHKLCLESSVFHLNFENLSEVLLNADFSVFGNRRHGLM
jgi:hypothetical protein